MSISADTWAVVLATGLGPIIAVGITVWFTHWREARDGRYNRRLAVLRTLMATRRTGISPDHVNALNLIEVDFYEKPAVETAWKEYKAHLFAPAVADASWQNKKEKLLSKLLFEMAKVLGFNIPAIDIFEGGYAPQGWEYRDNLQWGALEFLRDLGEAKRAVPLWIMGPPQLWGGQAPAEPKPDNDHP